MNTKKHHDNIMGINNNFCGYCMENFAYKSLLERHNKTNITQTMYYFNILK